MDDAPTWMSNTKLLTTIVLVLILSVADIIAIMVCALSVFLVVFAVICFLAVSHDCRLCIAEESHWL